MIINQEERLELKRQINAHKLSLRQVTTEHARGTMRETTRKARRWLLLTSFLAILWCFDIELKKIAPAGVEIGGNVQALIPIALAGLTIYFSLLFIIYFKSDIKYFEYLENEITIIMADINRMLSEMGYDPKNKKGADYSLLPIGKDIDEDTESFCRYQDGYLYKVGENLGPVRKASKLRFSIDYYFPIILAGCAILTLIIRYMVLCFQVNLVC